MMPDHKRTGRRLFRYAVIGGAAVLALIVLLLVFITIPPGENIIRGILEDQLANSLGQPVTIGNFETNLVSRIRIDSLRIPPREPDTGEGVFVNRLLVRYRLASLLSRTIDIRSLTIDTVLAGVVRDSAQGYNLALLDSIVTPGEGAEEKTDSGGGWTFRLGPTQIEHLRASYVDKTIPLQAQLTSVSLLADQSGPGGLAFSLRSDTGLIRYGAYSPMPLVLSARGVWTDSATVIDSLRVMLGDMVLAADGRLSTVDSMPVALSVQIEGEPEVLAAIAVEQFDMPEVRLEGPLFLWADVSGPAVDPRATVRVDLPTVHTADMTFREGHLVAEKNADTLVIDSLRVASLGGTIFAQGRMLIDTVLNGQLAIALHSIEAAELWQAVYDTSSPYQGQLSGHLSVDLRGNELKDWDLSADMTAQNASYRSSPLDNLAIRLALQDSRLRADVMQDYFRIRANVEIADSALDGTLEADIKRLGPLAGLLNLGEMSGALTAEADLSGTIDNPTVVALIRGNNLAYRGFPIDSLQARLRYADSSLFIEKLTAKGTATAYRAIEEIKSGFGVRHPGSMWTVGAFTQATEASDTAPDTTRAAPNPLFGVDSLFGGIEYTLNVSGPIDSLQGQLEADLTGLEYAGYAIDSGRVLATINGDMVIVDSLWVHRDSLFLQARGQYNTKSGVGSAAVDLFGRASGRMPDSVAVSENSTGAPPNLKGAYLPIGHVESDFTYSTEGSFDVAARGERLELGALSALSPDTTALGGIADFMITARGPIESLVADLELEIAQPRYARIAFDSISLAGSFDRGALTVRDMGAWRGERLLSGRFSARLSPDTVTYWTATGGTPIAGSIQVEELNLEYVQPFLPEGSQLAGIAWLDLQFDGILSDPNITGRLAVDSARYDRAAEGDSITGIRIGGTIADSTLTLDTAVAQINTIPLALEGSVTLASGSRVHMDITIIVDTLHAIAARGTVAEDSLDFSARIDGLNLSVLQPFVPRVDSLTGYLSAQVDLQGSPGEPQMDGRLTAADIVLKPDVLDKPFIQGRLAARFTADQLIIDTLTARMDEGGVTGSGTVDFDTAGLAGVKLEFTADSLEFTALDDIEIIVQNAQLTYQPSGEYYELAGTIDLGKVSYEQDFQPTELLPFAQQVQQVESELPALLGRTRLNVRFVDSDRIWVDNNLAKLRLNADMQVVGFVSDPNVSGRVLVEEGYILYLDRRFEVTEGVAYFIDPNEINPEVTLRAETEVTTYQQTQPTPYRISLVVTGRLQSPQVELTSQPVLARTDIISLLTLGATRQELGGRTGDILGRRAEALASEQISGFAAGRLGEALGLDEVTVTGNIFNVGDTTGPEVTLSKELSEEVTLTYRTTVGHLNEQEVSVNWQLSRYWLLEGTTTRRGESALSLTYALRFR